MAVTRTAFKPWSVFPPTCLLAPLIVHCFSNSMHAGLRLMLPRIPHNWPALWLWVQDAVLGSSFLSLFTFGTILVHLFVFWGLCALLLGAERSGFVLPWQVVDDSAETTKTTTTTDSIAAAATSTADSKGSTTATPATTTTTSKASSSSFPNVRIVSSAAFHALMSQLLVTSPLLLLATPLFYLRGVSIDHTLPSFSQHLLHIIVCIFAHEVCYYHLHRFMHSVAGLWEIHRRHHVKYFVTGLDALTVPVMELFLLRFIPYVAGPLLCGCHVSTLYVWTAVSTMVMVLMYSKHHFPLLPSPRAHLFHQQHYGRDAKPEKWTEGGASFGTLGVMDRWYETDNWFAPHAEHHKIIWDLEPPAKLKVGAFSTENPSWEFSWNMFFCVPWFNSWKPTVKWTAQTYWMSIKTFKANTICGLVGFLFTCYWYMIRDGVAWEGYPGAGPFCHAPNMIGFLWDTNVFNMSLYWVFCAMFLAVDGCFDALGLVEKYRVQYAPLTAAPGTTSPPLFHHIDWKMWVLSSHWVVCNFFSTAFMAPLFVAVMGFPSLCNSQPGWPAWYVVVLQLAVSTVLSDVWFFLSHRLNHSRWLYPHIHKQHHMLRATVAMGGVACHPVENWVVNFPTIFFAGYLTGHSLYVWSLWCSIATANVCFSHSGYIIPYFPMGGDPHDYHHWYLKCEYGAGGLMDALFGTSFKHYKQQQLAAKQLAAQKIEALTLNTAAAAAPAGDNAHTSTTSAGAVIPATAIHAALLQ